MIQQPFLSPTDISYFSRHEPQLFQCWDSLILSERLDLEHQLGQIDRERLAYQQQLLNAPKALPIESIDAFDSVHFSGNLADELRGQQLIEQGRVGCLLLAGGQGTRLQCTGPKGIYPISLVKRKSLFQICAEKVAAAGRRAGRLLRLAIMTSPANDLETRVFFHTHDYFGLDRSQVDFFVQGQLPFLDAEGRLFLASPSQIAMGPDGNGGCLTGFARSGCLKKWRQEGIEYLQVILIDNPLADPFDAELVGFHQRQQVEVTLKCTERAHVDEKVGLLTKQGERFCVVEYSEMPTSEREAKGEDGLLKHRCANLSLFCFSLPFIERMAVNKQQLPLHKAWKAVVDARSSKEAYEGFTIPSFAWKFETFIFDWVPFAEEAAALIYPREQCFAPLKNLIGEDSPATVQAALLRRDREIIERLTQLPPPDFPFELAADFYYPTASLKAEWKGKKVTEAYAHSSPNSHFEFE